MDLKRKIKKFFFWPESDDPRIKVELQLEFKVEIPKSQSKQKGLTAKIEVLRVDLDLWDEKEAQKLPKITIIDQGLRIEGTYEEMKRLAEMIASGRVVS